MSKPIINVTPLIDVLLVLLIIFMLVTPMRPSSFKTKIPKEPPTDNAEVHPDTLIVTVTTNNSLSLNKEQTSATIDDPEQLVNLLKSVFRTRQENLEAERTVYVNAPRDLDYGSVAKLIDAVKSAGADPISLQIDGLK